MRPSTRSPLLATPVQNGPRSFWVGFTECVRTAAGSDVVLAAGYGSLLVFP